MRSELIHEAEEMLIDAAIDTGTLPPMRLERRVARRHDVSQNQIAVERWDGLKKQGVVLGTLLDVSVGGIRVRTSDTTLGVGSQIRIKLTLPAYAGITPFVSESGSGSSEWMGWLSITRVKPVGDQLEIAGRMVDMRDIDRGMFGLYLSAQPLAA